MQKLSPCWFQIRYIFKSECKTLTKLNGMYGIPSQLAAWKHGFILSSTTDKFMGWSFAAVELQQDWRIVECTY